MKSKSSNDKIMVFLISFIVSLFFLWVHTQPGIIRSRLDMIYLLFGFVLPYVVGIVFIRYNKEDKKYG